MKSRKRTSFYNGTDYHCSVACVLNWTFMTISLLLVLKLLLVATPKECGMVLSKKKQYVIRRGRLQITFNKISESKSCNLLASVIHFSSHLFLFACSRLKCLHAENGFSHAVVLVA